MHIMSTNFAKTLVWKHENDVKLWRHKQCTPNDHHLTLNQTSPWKFSAYATRHAGFHGYQTCALCHEVSHRELLANVPYLPFVLLIVFFQSPPKIHGHTWWSEQRPIYKLKALRSFKLPFRQHGAIKLKQNCVCFTNGLCFNLFVPTFVTREYHPEILERLHLLQCVSAHL